LALDPGTRKVLAGVKQPLCRLGGKFINYHGWRLMNFERYLCSQLVAFRNQAVETTVNLEEIWEGGAVVESEEPVETGARVEIRSGRAYFSGEVMGVERHEFGWRVTVQFSPMTRWRLEEFEPEHLLLL
jgi:hypothetical protein